MSGLIKRSITVASHRTSVALEAEFWQVLDQIAATQGVSIARLISDLDADRSVERPLASLLRVYVLKTLCNTTPTVSITIRSATKSD